MNLKDIKHKIYTIIEQEVHEDSMDIISAVKSFNNIDDADIFLENIYDNLYDKCKVIEHSNYQHLYCETEYHKTYYKIVATHIYE